MTKERNYGIDLLRLVLMYMVCMLHTLGQGGILASSVPGTWGHKGYFFLETFAYCAVDGFAFISGYMASDKPRKYEKIIEMWFQVFFYSFVVTALFTLIGINESWEKADIIKCAFPVTYGKYWYFTAFFGLFFMIPILNRFLFTVDEMTAKKTFLVIFLIFSVMGFVADGFRTSKGYSAMWLIALYCMGVLAKRIKLFESQETYALIVLWALCIFVSWVLFIFAERKRWVSYLSPTILLSGILMVVLFSRLKLKGTIISKVSPLAFGIYLFQLNQVIWQRLKGAFAFVTTHSIKIGVFYVFGLAFAIFASGLIVEFVRSKIAKLIRLPALCRKIAGLFDRGLELLSVLLK